MLREMLHAKLHRGVVTEANPDYVGSITIDEDLLDAVDMIPNEKVLVSDLTNGARLETYILRGGRGSGIIGINGAAAHLVRAGDRVIIMSFVQLAGEAARTHRPRVAILDDDNRIVELLHGEVHGPAPA